MTVNGVINLNKRKGISSFKAVREVRNALGADKAGHTGTLDPEASGVLPVCLGKSTRIVDYLMSSKKEYRVTMYLGISTDTDDLEGEILSEKDPGAITDENILEVVKGFIGSIEQYPPVYSAIKVKGKRLYQYARSGEEVEIPKRSVEIFDIWDFSFFSDSYLGKQVKVAEFSVRCSKGTYIRSLCRDIGVKTDCPAVMAGLVRTASGSFRIEDSYTIEDIREMVGEQTVDSVILKPGSLLELPVMSLDDNQAEAYLKGQKLVITGCAQGEYVVKSNKDGIIGIGVLNEENRLKGRKRLI